jgi:DNA-binding NarL/FixJ family response regulator
MENNETLRVLVAASHPVVWQSIVHVLRSNEAFDVRGCSLQEFHRASPDLVDIILTVLDPVTFDLGNLEELFADLLDDCPQAKLVCLFLGENDLAVLTAVKAGASGIIAESDGGCGLELGEVISAIERVAAGEFVMSPSLAIHLAQLRATEVIRTRGPKDDSLTNRESEVLRLLAEGRTNRQIASCLSLSEHTVRSHLRGIMQKLRVTNRVQAAALAWSGSVQQQVGFRGER